ncbi:MAG TPA: hypothetical protein VKJ07_08105, partial [Mycobacteriales bacterium]|nr:hypothetical protein [Mycobacteriales bacterium]
MLVGTASVESFPRGTVTSWDTLAMTVDDTIIVQAMFELRAAGREAVLPPALHPTNPPTLVVQAWSTPAWSLVQVRVQCRSGLRPRGFVTGSVCDSADTGVALAAGWGFACRTGDVAIRRGYDITTVDTDGLSLRLVDPEPLDIGDAQYSSTLNLADTPNGLRLVQLDVAADLDRVERAQPALEAFDPAT